MVDLTGQYLPDIELPSTNGKSVNPRHSKGLAVYFIYPWTGKPDHPNPLDWNNIPGAHGSTPQLLGYSRLYLQFETLNIKLFGMSQLDVEWQRDFARRNNLPFPLLSDAARLFTNALGLENIVTGGMRYLTRRTFVARDGVIIFDRQIIEQPETDAEAVLHVLRGR